ncbi:hypothetical protein THIOM_000963, partial [Candidatus Thiomargarita nelsonii]
MILKWITRSLIGLLVLVLLVGISGYFYLKHTLPQISGRMALAGLEQTVSIQREPNGIVHIQAQTSADLFFALARTLFKWYGGTKSLIALESHGRENMELDIS